MSGALDILSQGGLTLDTVNHRLTTVYLVWDSLNQCLQSPQQEFFFLSNQSLTIDILFVCSRTLQILLARIQLHRTEI